MQALLSLKQELDRLHQIHSPCPVDCIVMKPLNKVSTWREEDANKARFRYQNKQQRLQKKAD